MNWKHFGSEEHLSDKQLEQFEKYLDLLVDWNEKINLTAITQADEIITYHFRDSLAVDRFIDFNTLHMICDVGTGGGFPGIALKIKYPHLKLVLIEVIQKKITFLHDVIQQLGLQDVEVSDLDWRNFLRHTNYPIDLFVARASLRPDELIHMFKGASPYKDKAIVYWASHAWKATQKDVQYVQAVHEYVVGKKRQLVVLAKSSGLKENTMSE